MKKLFKRLVRLGVYEDTPEELVDEIKVVNSIKVQGAILMILGVIPSYIFVPQHSVFTTAILLMHLVAAVSTLEANRRRAYGLAKWIFVMDPAVLMLSVVGYYGDDTNFQFVLLICLLMYVFLFRRRASQVFNMLATYFVVSIVGIAIIYFFDLAYVSLAPVELEIMRFTSFTFSVILVIMMGVVLQKTNRIRSARTLATWQVSERDASILQTISDNMDEAIFKSSVTQGLEYVNDAFAKMYGYASKEEVMGIHPVNLYESKSDRDTLLSRIEKFGRVTNMLLKYRRKDGSTFWGRLSSSKVHEAGEVFLVGTIADVTPQQEQTDLLQSSERQLREAQRLAKVGNWRAMPKEGRVEWSGEWANIHGFLPSDFADSFDVWCKGFLDMTLDEMTVGLERSSSMNKAFEFGSWYKTPEGEMKFLYYTSQKSVGDGSVEWFGTVQDRTELKNQELELLDTREFYQNVLDNIPVECVLVDENGKYFYISKNAIADDQLRQFLIGKNDLDYVQYRNLETSFAELRDERVKEALRGELSIRWEEKMKTRDGRDTYHIRNLVPVHFKEGRSVKKFLIGYSFDINEIKRAQFRLEGRNDELNQLNKELDRFVYSISHDLRAPIASVLGLNSLAEEAEDEGELNNILSMQREALDRLDRYIRDVIDYSRNKRLDVHPEEVRLKKVLDECMNDLVYMSNYDNLDYFIEVDDALTIHSDALRIRIIINNLLSNAIKYADPKKDKPFIAIRARNEAGKLTLEIEDNGIGIKKDHEDQIWDIFFRGTSTVPGSGLGLYILRESAKNIDGEVSYVSEEGVGTKLTVTLPELSSTE
ncbi:MAG: PAS domain S-box protein [Flavobacteriales bacterium]|nr:PAS domain S-box protein [Flavobacteriales bacterium]